MEDYLTKMLDHIDDHKKGYANWSNRDIAKVWIKCAPVKAENLPISDVSKSYRAMEAKKLSELVADFEKTTDQAKSELSEIKGTMVVNFSGSRDHLPKLLDGSEKTALQMFMKIIEHYHE